MVGWDVPPRVLEKPSMMHVLSIVDPFPFPACVLLHPDGISGFIKDATRYVLRYCTLCPGDVAAAFAFTTSARYMELKNQVQSAVDHHWFSLPSILQSSVVVDIGHCHAAVRARGH